MPSYSREAPAAVVKQSEEGGLPGVLLLLRGKWNDVGDDVLDERAVRVHKQVPRGGIPGDHPLRQVVVGFASSLGPGHVGIGPPASDDRAPQCGRRHAARSR